MRAAFVLTVGVLGLSCTSTPPAASQAIGPTGGTVSASSGVSIGVPPGALTSTATITIQDLNTPPAPAGAAVVGPGYHFGPEGQQFAAPVQVTLPFKASDLPSGTTAQEVVILTAPEGSSSFTSLGGTLTDSTHVQATTTHFSVFVPAVIGTFNDAGFVPDSGPLAHPSTPDAGLHAPDGGAFCAGCNTCCTIDGVCQVQAGNPMACGIGGVLCQVCNLDAGQHCSPQIGCQ
jgi:hypothetical protein